MFDGEPAVHSSNRSHGRRGYILRASLKHVFWRAPHWWELLICALYALAVHFWSESSFDAIASRTLWVFFVIRSWEFAHDYCGRKWPRKDAASFFLYAFLFLIFVLPIFKAIFQNPPKWEQALAVVAFIAAGFAWIFPLMWSLDRVFKPWMRRTEYWIFPALAFVVCCGLWFFVSMCLFLRFTGAIPA